MSGSMTAGPDAGSAVLNLQTGPRRRPVGPEPRAGSRGIGFECLKLVCVDISSHSRESGNPMTEFVNDVSNCSPYDLWIPAFAGMTE